MGSWRVDWRSAPDSRAHGTIEQSRGRQHNNNNVTAHAIATEVLLLRQHTLDRRQGRIEWVNGSNYPARSILNRVIKYAM